MISIKRAMKSNAILRALTGLKIRQFKMLATNFAVHLKKSFEEWRNVSLDRGREFVLKSSEEKLFFILFYMKCYPTHRSLWVVLRRAQILLLSMGTVVSPLRCKRYWEESWCYRMRKISDPQEFLRLFPGVQAVFIDGTERPIQRPKDQERQKANYSGKKKRHTRANIVVNDENKRILIVSGTVEGKEHDFKI